MTRIHANVVFTLGLHLSLFNNVGNRVSVVRNCKYILAMATAACITACSQTPAEIINKGIGLGRQTQPQTHTSPQERPRTITVKNGDSLYQIANHYNVGTRDLIQLNGLTPPYALITGQALQLPQAKYYQVKPGDTLYSVSRMFNVDMGRLIHTNSLPQPYVIKTGTRLQIPSSTYATAVEDKPAEVVESVAVSQDRSVTTTETHTIAEPGTTLLEKVSAIPAFILPKKLEEDDGLEVISSTEPTDKNNADDVEWVAEEKPAPEVVDPEAPKPMLRSELTHPEAPTPALKPGTTLASMEWVKTEPATMDTSETVMLNDEPEKTGSVQPVDTSPSQAEAFSTYEKASYDVQGAIDSAQGEASTEEMPKSTGFSWPLKGKIVSRFGPKRGGLYNDGLNIAAKEGASIVAADGGQVVYSGNELRGYGNLVLIKHDNGYVTAYAHAKDILVKKGDMVQKGQRIAYVGTTGHVTQPQLHFSIRKGSKAIDPQTILPAG